MTLSPCFNGNDGSQIISPRSKKFGPNQRHKKSPLARA